MSGTSGQPKLASRCLVSAIAGATTFSLILGRGHADARGLAWDFTWPWRAARIILNGFNPYTVIQATGPYPFSDRLRYPLPAAVVSLPFAHLDPWNAGAAFAATGMLLFCFAITREGWFRLPLLFSSPVLLALWLCQWSPLLTAASILPVVGGVLVCKPTLGLALFTFRPRRSVIIGATLLSAIAFIFVPDWPLEWLRAAHGAGGRQYLPPAARLWLGPLLLLAALRWRLPQGRLVLTMALVPQTLAFYDQVPLLLVPRSVGEVWMFTVCSQVAFIGAWLNFQTIHGHMAFDVISVPWTLAGCYLPAVIMVLRRPASKPTGIECPLRRWRCRLSE